MKLQRRGLGVAAALGVALAAIAPPSARALTLADLVGGGGFSVGLLSFSDFDVSIGGDLSADLADYPVQILPDGFRLTGPLSSLLGASGTLLLSYDVTAADPMIDGVSLFAPGTTIGSGAQAWVAESVLGPGNSPLASLFVYDLEGVGASPSDAASFAAVSAISVAKTVQVGGGIFAVIPVVDQRFSLVPEPWSLAMVSAGLAGLALFGRRHVRMA
jgi:hypothetical protein